MLVTQDVVMLMLTLEFCKLNTGPILEPIQAYSMNDMTDTVFFIKLTGRLESL